MFVAPVLTVTTTIRTSVVGVPEVPVTLTATVPAAPSGTYETAALFIEMDANAVFGSVGSVPPVPTDK